MKFDKSRVLSQFSKKMFKLTQNEIETYKAYKYPSDLDFDLVNRTNLQDINATCYHVGNFTQKVEQLCERVQKRYLSSKMVISNREKIEAQRRKNYQ